MTARSLYPEDVEVRQAALEYTESTKSIAIRNTRADFASEALISGFTVTVNVGTATLVDVAAGAGYTSNGERVELTAAVTGVALSDYTDGVDNYICVTYTEVSGSPAPHATDGTTRNTQVSAVVGTSVFTLTELNGLPTTAADQATIARDRVLVVAIVNADGAGNALEAADITQTASTLTLPTLTTLKLNRDGSNTITGTILPDADNTRGFGQAGTALGTIYVRDLIGSTTANATISGIQSLAVQEASFGPAFLGASPLVQMSAALSAFQVLRVENTGTFEAAEFEAATTGTNPTVRINNTGAGGGLIASGVSSANATLTATNTGTGSAASFTSSGTSNTVSITNTSGASGTALRVDSQGTLPTVDVVASGGSGPMRLSGPLPTIDLRGTFVGGLTEIRFNGDSTDPDDISAIINSPDTGGAGNTACRTTWNLGGGNGDLAINARQVNITTGDFNVLTGATVVQAFTADTFIAGQTIADTFQLSMMSFVREANIGTINDATGVVTFNAGGIAVFDIGNLVESGWQITQIAVDVRSGSITGPNIEILVNGATVAGVLGTGASSRTFTPNSPVSLASGQIGVLRVSASSQDLGVITVTRQVAAGNSVF